MQQLFDSEGHIIFSNKHTNFEKQLTKLQNLTLYNTNCTFLYKIVNHSLENCFFFVILTRLSINEKKLEQTLQKKTDEIFNLLLIGEGPLKSKKEITT